MVPSPIAATTSPTAQWPARWWRQYSGAFRRARRPTCLPTYGLSRRPLDLTAASGASSRSPLRMPWRLGAVDSATGCWRQGCAVEPTSRLRPPKLPLRPFGQFWPMPAARRCPYPGGRPPRCPTRSLGGTPRVRAGQCTGLPLSRFHSSRAAPPLALPPCSALGRGLRPPIRLPSGPPRYAGSRL